MLAISRVTIVTGTVVPSVKVGHCTSGPVEFKRARTRMGNALEGSAVGLAIAGGVVTVAIVLIVAYIIRQLRRVKRLQADIDYSKVRHWKDEDED
jgi:hypothetical protein